MHFVELTPLLLTKESNYVLPARSNRIEAEFGKCWGFSLIQLSRFVFPGIFVTVCLSLTLLLPKQIILKQKKSPEQRKFKNPQKAYPTLYSTSLFVYNLSNSII